jgi:hypothetical protein
VQALEGERSSRVQRVGALQGLFPRASFREDSWRAFHEWAGNLNAGGTSAKAFMMNTYVFKYRYIDAIVFLQLSMVIFK